MLIKRGAMISISVAVFISSSTILVASESTLHSTTFSPSNGTQSYNNSSGRGGVPTELPDAAEVLVTLATTIFPTSGNDTPSPQPTNASSRQETDAALTVNTDSNNNTSALLTEVTSHVPTNVSTIEVSSSAPTDAPNTLLTDMSSTRTSEVLSTTSSSKGQDRVPTRAGQLVKCHCHGDEVLTANRCQHYPDGTKINFQKDVVFTVQKDVSELNVVVQDLSCDVKNHYQQLNFSKNQFRLRDRGDVVLLEEAGEFDGLRINNFCVIHYLDKEGELTWKMKACVRPPDVPRCCPPGQAMVMGTCQPSQTPHLLTPPMTAKPFGEPIDWPTIKNFENPISCQDVSNPLREIPLGDGKSHIVSLHTGVLHAWIPPERRMRHKFTYLPKFCIDGKQSDSKSVSYSAYLCYATPLERHQQVCRNNLCVRKCCQDGEVMSAYLSQCRRNDSVSFKPPFASGTNPKYKTVIGWPLCSPQSEVENYTLLYDGHLSVQGKNFPPDRYCIDIFVTREGNLKESAMACILEPATWEIARSYIFPICRVLSLVFLVLTMVCYFSAPVLLKNSGWYQVCHVASLIIAFISGFIVQIFNKEVLGNACVVTGVIMQFGYFGTFLWLNVLCFEVARKIRSLVRIRPAEAVRSWIYPLYAWGLSFLMCFITCVMQYGAPDTVPGIYKPHIGINRCWFYGDLELLIYFYGPIAFIFILNFIFIFYTYWIYREIEGNANFIKNLGTKKTSDTNTAPARVPDHVMRKRDYITEFKQQFSLHVLSCACWVTEVLSWKIPPPELWSVTDILNTLQGVIIFFILMTNKSRRKVLREKNPKTFSLLNRCLNTVQKSCCNKTGKRKDSKSSAANESSGVCSASTTVSSMEESRSTSLSEVSKEEGDTRV